MKSKVKEEAPTVDILNRDDFIGQTIQLIKSISSHQGNSTFAIDGKWGCGKTFVLKKIERRLLEDSSKNFFVIHYNCWKHDYYDEPLVAIISVLSDTIDKTKRISKKTKLIFKKMLFKLSIGAVSSISKLATTFDMGKPISDAVDAKNEATDELNKYDGYYDIREALIETKNELKKISKRKTIIIVVDELDRCLPEYAIKVLERLHHISEGIPNIIVVIAIDKSKLERTISSIFGCKNVATYLKKFIKFEIKLDNGKQDGTKFWDKFISFRNRFDENLFPNLEKQKEFIEELFQGIDARSQEHIIEKATLFNDICFGDEKQDYSMMYMELFIATFYYHYGEENFFSNDKVIHDLEQVFEYKNIPKSFGKKGSGFYLGNNEFVNGGSEGLFYINPYDIFMLVIHYWYGLFEGKRTVEEICVPYLESDQSLSIIGDNQKKLISNINILKIIK